MTINRILKNKFINNGIWLYLMQFFNTIVPLSTLPYITRILGPTEYGFFAFSLNIIMYLQIIVEYGFNLTGVKKIAKAKGIDEKARIFSNILSSKILLFCISGFVCFLFVYASNITEKQIYCMLILFITIFGEVLRQTWIFQGLQEMKYITYVSIVSRLISVACIFIFVKTSEQLYLYCFLYSLTFLLVGIISLFIVKNRFKFYFVNVSLKEIVNELKEGWDLFTVSAMSKTFSGFSLTVLGFYAAIEEVGAYAAVQKITFFLALIYAPISQIIYPYISSQYDENFANGLSKIRKVSFYVIGIFFCIMLILIVFSKNIVVIIYGIQYIKYYYLIFPLSLWLFFSIINNLLGVQVLVASGHNKLYRKAFSLSMITVIFSNFIGAFYLQSLGVAIATLFSEMVLSVILIISVFMIKKVS